MQIFYSSWLLPERIGANLVGELSLSSSSTTMLSFPLQASVSNLRQWRQALKATNTRPQIRGEETDGRRSHILTSNKGPGNKNEEMVIVENFSVLIANKWEI